jgi:two-component system, NtrC family, C4-dicarboxylate transport sensor histidine kinase DctB
MRADRFFPRAAFALYLVVVAGAAAAVWNYGYLRALDQLAQRGEADLSLAADRLTGQLQLYQQLAVLMADHPALMGQGAKALLQAAADKTAALDMMLVNRQGRVLASANGIIGPDVAQTRYFQRALQGALGEAHGVIADAALRAYYFAAPRFDASGAVSGALVVVANIDRVEAEWRGGRPVVFFTDRSGEVFISNRSELLFWRQEGQGLRPHHDSTLDFELRQVGPHNIWVENWSPYVPGHALHLKRDLPVIGMVAQALVDVSPAWRLAALQAAALAALLVAFGVLLFWLTGRRRVLAQANARLEGRVAERTAELSETNAQLLREVAERIAAEAALKKAQSDLVQAGKLTALGQMSAGISHELNQPLMAIQQYAENGAMVLERGKPELAAENLGRISALAARAARIIKNLRAFARNEAEPMGQVDIVAVVETALDLLAPRLRQDAILVNWHRPSGPIWVRGGEVRLGQVLVNLLGNAADAMADATLRRITISVVDGSPVRLRIADTGPGIEEPDKIFDPFYTTKAVGAAQGMGLGLSISYGLVQSFGGKIRGANGPDGAEFTVELEPWNEEKAA